MLDFGRIFLTCCIFSLGVAGAGVVMAEQQNFTLEMDSSVAVPEETVSPDEVDGEYRITEVGLSLPGESITAEITPPDEQFYVVYLRNQDGDPVDGPIRNLEGEQTVTLDATGEPAGSYVITVGSDADPDDILPVAIEAYRVDSATLDGESLDGGELESSDTGNVTVSLTEYEDRNIDEVELSVWQEDVGEVDSVTLSETDQDLVFSGSISGLDPDTYNVQFRIRGGDTVDNDEPELIGLSENKVLTVTESEPSNDDGGGGSSDHSDETNDGTDDGTSGQNDENDTADSVSDDEMGDQNDENGTANNASDDEVSDHNETSLNSTDTESHNETADDDESGTADETSSNTTQSDSGDDVITPNTSADETDDDMPLTAIPLVFALLALFGVTRRLSK